MSRSDNYPDDMRRYDNDPRSPEFIGPDEEITIVLTPEEVEQEERVAYNEYWRKMFEDDNTDTIFTYDDDDDEDVTEPRKYPAKVEDLDEGLNNSDPTV